MAVANPGLYAGEQSTKHGCSCGGRFFLESQRLGFSKDDEAMVDTLTYICGKCKIYKHISIPMRGEKFKKMADNARRKLAR